MSSIGVRQGFTYQFFLNETHKKLFSLIIELYLTEASASFHYFTINYFTNYHESEYFSLINPHAPDRFTPSRARCAKSCGAVHTHG